MRIRSGATGFCVTAAVAAMATAGFAWPAVLMGWGMSTLVMLALGVYRHRSNLERLRNGTENKIGQKAK